VLKRRFAGHEIAAFMIEKKRDVWVGFSSLFALQSCRGFSHRGGGIVRAGLGANGVPAGP
jgi:hypothetical protein